MNGPRRSRFDLAGFHERVYRSRPPRLHPLKIGLVVVAVLCALAYLVVAKSIPFTGSDWALTAVFDNSSTIVEGSPVRIAGVNVGEVTEIEADGATSRVTFNVEEAGRPVFADANVTIRPRLFLEGNLFIDLAPGSPGNPELSDGGTIPVTRTARAVQFDEVLGTLTRPTRADLEDFLAGFGGALTRTPTRAEDADQDPGVRGKSAAQALAGSFASGADAGRSSAVLARAMRGVEENDLTNLISDASAVFGVLAAREQSLRELITNLSVTAGALADESRALGRGLNELDRTLAVARPALSSTDRVLPELRAFARAMTPSVEAIPATIVAGNPWLRQARPLLGEPELGGIVRLLAGAAPGLGETGAGLTPAMNGLGAISRCATDVLVPTADGEISDPFATGVPNYADFFYGAVFQAGEGANFDGNGQYLRVQAGGGPVRVEGANPNGGFNNEVLYANATRPPLGSQPRLAAARPPVRYDVDCDRNRVPELNGPAATPGPPSPKAVP